MNTISTQPAVPSPQEQAHRLFSGLAAALFDLDNTLIETHIDFPLMKREMLALVARYGLDPAPLTERDILGIVEAARESLQEAGREADSTRFRTEAFARLEEIEIEHCAAPVELPGASELLAALRARAVPVAIVTRNCRAVAERLIRQGRLACDVLLAREDVARTKPHPDHLNDALHALAQQNARPDFPPAACLMVGDHWMDVAAGRAAGMRTIGLRRQRPADFFAPAPPDLLVGDMAELWRLVEEAGRREEEGAEPASACPTSRHVG
ncbi:MAG TPA: HAD family phosphatase [Chthonomonadaceae bacterium]|nr:HAD family phosphatase [Chthonomonadaceae bacterium]